MNPIQKTWRDYTGEDLIRGIDYVNGEKVQDIEHYPKLPYDVKTKGYAIVLGNGVTRTRLSVEEYYQNNGGLRNKYKAETYGCNAIYRDGDVDHLIINNKPMLDQAVKKKIYNRMAVYTHYSHWLRTESTKVRLIPQRVIGDAGTLALYMACFHGNHTVWMVGFDHYDGPGSNVYEGTEFYANEHTIDECRKWITAQKDLMQYYSEVNFIRVTDSANRNRKHEWQELSNYKEINFKQFIQSADIGLITRD